MANQAYDFSMFETGKQKLNKPEIKEVKRPNLKPVEKNSKALKAQKKNRLYSAIFAIGFLAITVLFITSKVQYSELNTTYNNKSKELQQLEAAYVGLEMQYEASISVDNIEDYAIDVLGMQLAQSNQIKLWKKHQ